MGRPELHLETERTVAQARKEAVRMGHSRVGSEHLLLALLVRRRSEAAWVLQRHGWEEQGLRSLLDRGTPGLPLLRGLSAAARSVLFGAGNEAKGFGTRWVMPEHLLLALLRQGESTAARLLAGNGTSLDGLFTELYLTMRDGTRRPREGSGVMRLLEQFAQDMIARVPEMDPVIGREEEIETVIGILCRKNKNNPALIGEPGVGKTAVVEGLAQRMSAGQVPEQLQGKRLLSVDLASVLAGTKYRGEFEERIRDILAEVRRCGNVILFVDEMHTLVGAGSAEGAIDAANLLKPSLSRGEVQLIGATTMEEYRKHIEKDAALERRFRRVTVREPERADALAMLEGLRPGLEKHHHLRIPRESLEAAVDLSRRYLPEHFLPDKAVDLLDEAASRVRNRRRETRNAEAQRQQLNRDLNLAVQEHRFEQAAALRDKLQGLLRQQRSSFNRLVLEPEDLAATVAQRTGIPVGKISQTDRERLIHLREELEQRILGQPEAVRAVAEAVCRGRMGLADGSRPVASMLFLGPTGVGKTALCKALADCVYGSGDAMIRLDMSEYMEQHAVSRLLGAPPGYVGHGEGGELTEKVRRRPYCVVLLDELEKAHPDVTGILLQVLEDGVLTDSMGRRADFRNAIIVMTSNLGSGEKGLEQVGFLGSGKQGVSSKALRSFFRPEFLGRLDTIAQFRPLEHAALRAIAAKELEQTAQRAALAGAELQLDPAAADCLADICTGEEGGARALRRQIRTRIEAPAAQLLLEADGPVRLQVQIQNGSILVCTR